MSETEGEGKGEESSETSEESDPNEAVELKINKTFMKLQVKTHFAFKINVLFYYGVITNRLQIKLEEILNLLQSKINGSEGENETDNEEIKEENKVSN